PTHVASRLVSYLICLHSAPIKPFPLSLHDALPIWTLGGRRRRPALGRRARPGACEQARRLGAGRRRGQGAAGASRGRRRVARRLDRKSTRLNSSHVKISYAVFCLEKKNSTEVSMLS